jgi:16S rRNA (guanine(966)-N(2))-methyltransferase RsmD
MNITGGIYKGRKITAPDEKVTRPTLSKTRESVFNVLYSLIDFEEKIFLDMFAGSGIMGLEALSRGFKDVYAIEKNFKVAKILKSNYSNLGLSPNLIIGDSLKTILKLNKTFDVIYIDPPYNGGLYQDCLRLIKQSELLNPNGIVILEHSGVLDFEGYQLIKQKTYSQKFISFLIK